MGLSVDSVVLRKESVKLKISPQKLPIQKHEEREGTDTIAEQLRIVGRCWAVQHTLNWEVYEGGGGRKNRAENMYEKVMSTQRKAQ